MKQTLCLWALLALLAGCDSQNTNSAKETSPSATTTDSAANGADVVDSAATAADAAPIDSNLVELVPAPGQVNMVLPATTKSLGQLSTSVRVHIHRMTGYGPHEPFARAAAQKLQDVLNSQAFKSAILANTYAYDAGQALTPAQLHARIMRAHEDDGPGGEDGVVDLRLRTLDLDGADSHWRKYCNRSTIGVDGGGSGVAAICPNWLADRAAEKDTAALAAHFAHEYMHVLGFTHRRRKFTKVPYKVGNLVERLAKIPRSAAPAGH